MIAPLHNHFDHCDKLVPGYSTCKMHRSSRIKKAPPRMRWGFIKFIEGIFPDTLGMPGDDLLSHSVVPSALERFTVEFEMGSSGGVPLLSPGKRRMPEGGPPALLKR